MIRRLALAWLVLSAVSSAAWANGRPPATSSITFRQGHESDVAVGLTFGLLISHDGGATWAWICEKAVGYSGEYDPRYAFSPSGALFATTFDGFKVERDSCTFGATPAGATFVSTNTLGADHTLYYTAGQHADTVNHVDADYRIYRSTDDGVSFTPTPGQPDGPVSWWESLAVAPSDQHVLYLSGYAYVPGPADAGTVKQQLLFRSDNAGVDWTSIAVDPSAVTIAPNSVIDIAGIAADDPAHVYIRVTNDDNISTQSIYRSSDRGATWQRIAHDSVPLDAFVVRAARNPQGKYDLIVGTQANGAQISHDDGDTWTALVNPPRMNCLVENAAGELWACTQNYNPNGGPFDDAGIMKTTNPEAAAWTKVLRYEDLTEAVPCAAGTPQATDCATMWCAVCKQLGCTPSASYHCGAVEAPAPSKAGCCDGGGGGTGVLALGLPVGMVLLRPRRRRVIQAHASHPRNA